MFRWLKWLLYTLFFLLFLCVVGAMFGYFYNGSKVRAWVSQPQPPGQMVSLTNYRLYAHVAEPQPRPNPQPTSKPLTQPFAPTVVVFPGLGSPSFEWWSIQQTLARSLRVVTYDRGGYGWSEPGEAPRTSERIVLEARILLETRKVPPPYILVGHATGAFYAQHFARLYPQQVKSVVLLDPVIDDQLWKSKLPPALYQKFIDQTLFIKRGRTLAMFGLFRLLMALPKDIPAQHRRHIIEVFSNPDSYKIFLDEYLSLFGISFPSLAKLPAFPNIPLAILFRDSELAIQRMMKFNTPREQAMLVENTWTSLTREYLKLSPHSRWIVAQNSSHSIHLDRPDLVVQTILDVAKHGQ